MSEQTSGGGARGGGLPPILTPAQVAEMFAVDRKTVARWASLGQIPSFRTPGGHRRYDRDEILAVLRDSKAAGG